MLLGLEPVYDGAVIACGRHFRAVKLAVVPFSLSARGSQAHVRVSGEDGIQISLNRIKQPPPRYATFGIASCFSTVAVRQSWGIPDATFAVTAPESAPESAPL